MPRGPRRDPVQVALNIEVRYAKTNKRIEQVDLQRRRLQTRLDRLAAQRAKVLNSFKGQDMSRYTALCNDDKTV